MRATCDNCGTPIEGQFCSQCGQSVGSIDLPAIDFARDIASEALGLDSRVRRTLVPLIIRPGRVAKEYVEGHRARFVPPVRLYLLASFFMFVVLSLGEFEVSNVQVGGRAVTLDSIAAPAAEAAPVADSTAGADDSGDTSWFMVDLGADDLNERLAVGFQRLMADPGAFNEIFIDRLAKSMFVLLPVFAGLLKLLWWKRLYVHHAIFAIYFHSFVFLLVGLLGLPEAIGLERLGRILDVLLLSVPIYLLLALRTFYASSWLGTLLRGAVVTATYGLLGIAAVMTLLVVSVLSL